MRQSVDVFAAGLAIIFSVFFAFAFSLVVLAYRAFVVYLCFKWLSPAITVVALPVPTYMDWALVLLLLSAIRPHSVSAKDLKDKENQKLQLLGFFPTGLLMIFIAFVLKCILL
jgi:hypothetical protein